MRVLLATGVEDLDKEISALLEQRGIEVIGECGYREGIFSLLQDRKADVVVVSPKLSGTLDIASVIYSLRREKNVRVILLPGRRDDPEADGIAKKAVSWGVYDLVWDLVTPAGVVHRILAPATLADVGIDPDEDTDASRAAVRKIEPRSFWKTLCPFFIKRPETKREHLKERACARPTRSGLFQPLVVAVGISLPGVPERNAVPFSADIVLFAPDKADPSLLSPGAKGYIVGTGASAWRKAALTGLLVVTPEAASALVSASGHRSHASCTVVYSSSTAVGKTSVAFTLSALLAKGRRVCLVDTDSGKPTLTELVTGRFDATGKLDGPLSTRWGFDFVPNVQDGDGEGVAELLTRYDEVVVDCPGRLNLLPLMEAFLRAADRVLLVSDCTNRSVAAVRNFALGGMRELDVVDRTLLVVNRKENRPFLKPKEVAERVGMPLHLELPHDPLVERMFEERQPLTHFKTKKPSPFLLAVEKLTEKPSEKEGGANDQLGVPADSTS